MGNLVCNLKLKPSTLPAVTFYHQRTKQLYFFNFFDNFVFGGGGSLQELLTVPFTSVKIRMMMMMMMMMMRFYRCLPFRDFQQAMVCMAFEADGMRGGGVIKQYKGGLSSMQNVFLLSS